MKNSTKEKSQRFYSITFFFKPLMLPEPTNLSNFSMSINSNELNPLKK